MQLFFKSSWIFIFTFLLSINLNGKNKDIILCLDESGSMNGEKFINLVYAIQLTASLLDESDNLFIIRGGARTPIKIDLTNKKNEIERKIKNRINRPTGHTPECDVLEPAYQLMLKNTKREKIIIIYGDGDWSKCGTEKKIVRDFEKVKPKIIFFKIENFSIVEDQSNLEYHLKGLPPAGFKVFKNPANDLEKVKENLFKLSKYLIDADPKKITPVISNNTIKFTPKFPLKKLLFIVQKDNCSLLNTTYTVQEKIEVSNLQIGGDLTGTYYEIASPSKSILPANKPIEIKMDCPINLSEVEIIPIVAMELDTKVEGNSLKKNDATGEYKICSSETEVKITMSLKNDIGKKIKLSDLKGINLIVSNGKQQRELVISGEEASGKINLLDTISYLTVEAQYDGYFHKKSRIFIVRKQPCPLKLEVDIDGDVKERSKDGKKIKVCQHVNELNIKSIIKDENGIQKSFAELKEVTVEVKTNTSKYVLKNQSKIAIGKIKLEESLTEVTFRILVNDNPYHDTITYSIQKLSCVDTVVMDIGEIPLMEFVKTGKCVDEVNFTDMSTNTLINTQDYDLAIKGVPRELTATIDASGQYFKLCLNKKTLICDCFVRHGTFEGIIIATPKEKGNFLRIEKKWQFTILPEKNWITRTRYCLILFTILGIIVWYIWGIIQKPRFHRSARFTFIEEDRNRRYGSNPEDEFWLKSKSFFKRWLVPYLPEKKIIGDDNLLIIAHSRKNMIYLSKESFTPKMKINGSKPEEKATANESLGENDYIRITKSNSVSVKYTFQIN